MLFWVDHLPRPGWMQMALDRAMLELAETEALQLLRIYFWDQPTISFGANESALRHWDKPKIAQAGIATVRRPTGGRAVWHDPRDLTYAMVQPVKGIAHARARYRETHQELLQILNQSGFNGILASPPQKSPDLGPGSCFETAAGGEVVIKGRKTIGSAQLVHQGALLQHGEIARSIRHNALTPFAVGPARHIKTADQGMADTLPPATKLARVIEEYWLSRGAQRANQETIHRWLTFSGTWQGYFQDAAWTWRR